MLTSKLHVLLNIMAPCWWIFTRQGFFCWDNQIKGNIPMLTSKLHIFLNISAPCWWIFMRLLIQGFFWWDYQKSHVFGRPFASFSASCIQSSHTHIHTYIRTCMYVNVSDNYLFVPNPVQKSMCMLYISYSLCYIDSLCNWHMNIKRSDEVCNILSKSV